MNYLIWGQRELIQRIHELERRERDIVALISEKCAYCEEPMNTTIRAHHHTEVIDGVHQDVTTAPITPSPKSTQ